MPKHTPREIVEQCILRWEVSKDLLWDGLEELTVEEQNKSGFEIAELEQQIEAGKTILEEFNQEGV